MSFHGTFEHSLDSKSRLTVPSRFRNDLSQGVFLVIETDPCVSVYPAADYESITQAALVGLNPLEPRARELKRLFHSRATHVELDGAGRVMLKPEHRAHAGIDRDVLVTGAGDCLELWNPAGWRAYDADLTTRAPEITASLGHPA